MGVETTTIQNLEIIEVNVEDKYILVSGNIPGAKKSLVLIKTAVKKPNEKASAKEILEYSDEAETVVDEVVEETVEESVNEETPEVEEAVEEQKEEATEEETETEENQEESK